MTSSSSMNILQTCTLLIVQNFTTIKISSQILTNTIINRNHFIFKKMILYIIYTSMNIYSLITPEILEYSVGIPNNFDKDDSHAKKLKINSV